jgi:transaldolase
MNPLQQLHASGQSVWLDALRRGMLLDGTFERMVREWSITGVTSNPTIFAAALRSGDYDGEIAAAAGRKEPLELFYDLALRDIQVAADLLRPTWHASEGADGYASFELVPDLADDAPSSVRSARQLLRRIDRPNVMIKVPGTDAGVDAARQLTAEGHNVNVTLLFSVGMYERFADAYLDGLEARLAAGNDVADVASVASFFVSRIDAAVDASLPARSPLRGQAAVANARHAYHRFHRIFSGPRWDRLRAEGARPQRPLWASTGTKDSTYSDVKYIEELVAPKTITTVPEATLRAFVDHGVAEPVDMDRFSEPLGKLRRAGVDLDLIGTELLRRGIEAFTNDMAALLQRLRAAEPGLPTITSDDGTVRTR